MVEWWLHGGCSKCEKIRVTFVGQKCSVAYARCFTRVTCLTYAVQGSSPHNAVETMDRLNATTASAEDGHENTTINGKLTHQNLDVGRFIGAIVRLLVSCFSFQHALCIVLFVWGLKPPKQRVLSQLQEFCSMLPGSYCGGPSSSNISNCDVSWFSWMLQWDGCLL